MKKIILFLTIALVFAACEKDEPKAFKIDPLATVNIKPAASTPLKVRGVNADAVQHLTALQIVEQATIIQYNFKGDRWERVFESNQRDLNPENPMLKMYGLDIINQEGNYVPDFIESVDCLIIKFDLFAPYGAPRDTLAYIPNATLRAAETVIKQAYESKNEQLVLNTFNTAFTFLPITGAEWRALKAAGQN